MKYKYKFIILALAISLFSSNANAEEPSAILDFMVNCQEPVFTGNEETDVSALINTGYCYGRVIGIQQAFLLVEMKEAQQILCIPEENSTIESKISAIQQTIFDNFKEYQQLDYALVVPLAMLKTFPCSN